MTPPTDMFFSGRPETSSLEEFQTWFRSKMDGWNFTHKDDPLDLRDRPKLVAYNFRHGALKWWKETIAEVMEMIKWYKEVEGQKPSKEVHSGK